MSIKMKKSDWLVVRGLVSLGLISYGALHLAQTKKEIQKYFADREAYDE